jgi:flavin-binding protein dodecin
VTATYAVDEQPPSGHPLRPGAAPHDIRQNLLPEDREQFDAAYEQALADARKTLDLTVLFKILEQWRRLAVLQSDRSGYRHAVRRAAELLTGEPVPEDEPLSVTRAKAGM